MATSLAPASPDQLDVPVVLFLFRRPALTARVFAAIAQARPRRLFLVADGPRPDHPAEAAACAAARAVVQRVDWPCTVTHDYAETNLGLPARFETALAAVFAAVDQAIILEDDCLPSASFFRFCAELLARYADDPRVMAISGDRFTPSGVAASYAFSRYPHCFGWATWRRAWQFYDAAMLDWPRLRATPWLNAMFRDRRAARHWRGTFDAVYARQIDSWAYRWTYSCWRHGGLTALPAVNLVQNIGFGDDSTHTHNPDSPIANLPAGELAFPLRHPPAVVPDERSDARTQRLLFDPTLRVKLAWRLRRLQRIARTRLGGQPRAGQAPPEPGAPATYVLSVGGNTQIRERGRPALVSVRGQAARAPRRSVNTYPATAAAGMQRGSFTIDPSGLSPAELAVIQALLARLAQHSPTLADLWRLMDDVWAELGLDERRPDPVLLRVFYCHPIWALNGMFTEQDPQSRGHRAALVAWLQRLAPARVLDYGGGYGALARMAAAALPASTVELYDPFPSAAARARAAAHPNLRIVRTAGRGYDAVLCLDVLEHVPDPLEPLAEMVAALRPGGYLAIANNFYPLIRCHLPGTFHLRYSFPLFAGLLGLRREGRVPAALADIYRKTGDRPPPWPALRALELASRAAYPALLLAHRVYRRARGRAGV